MLGGDGADTLRGGGDDDHLAGGAGADLLFGDSVDTAGSGEDTLLGGEGADTLRGDGGDDWLEGGPGDDVLDGGPGDDLYVFGRGDGADTLSGIGAAPDDWDRLQFGAGIGADQLWLRRVAADLEVSVIGTADRLTLPGWFGETPGAIEEIALDSGGRLLASRVQVLVDAMAAFSPPPSGQVTLPDSYRESLDPVIAASWG
jgi:Ca2+-binding RTX toxin-like protein